MNWNFSYISLSCYSWKKYFSFKIQTFNLTCSIYFSNQSLINDLPEWEPPLIASTKGLKALYESIEFVSESKLNSDMSNKDLSSYFCNSFGMCIGDKFLF